MHKLQIYLDVIFLLISWKPSLIHSDSKMEKDPNPAKFGIIGQLIATPIGSLMLAVDL